MKVISKANLSYVIYRTEQDIVQSRLSNIPYLHKNLWVRRLISLEISYACRILLPLKYKYDALWGQLCDNITLSTKPEVHNAMPSDEATYTKFDEIRRHSFPVTQADRQTGRHAHRNSSHRRNWLQNSADTVVKNAPPFIHLTSTRIYSARSAFSQYGQHQRATLTLNSAERRPAWIQ